MSHRFEVISLDMFQTLVNVDSRKEQVWERILQDTYTSELASEYGRTFLVKSFISAIRSQMC